MSIETLELKAFFWSMLKELTILLPLSPQNGKIDIPSLDGLLVELWVWYKTNFQVSEIPGSNQSELDVSSGRQKVGFCTFSRIINVVFLISRCINEYDMLMNIQKLYINCLFHRKLMWYGGSDGYQIIPLLVIFISLKIAMHVEHFCSFHIFIYHNYVALVAVAIQYIYLLIKKTTFFPIVLVMVL